jgi:hypothetical protein
VFESFVQCLFAFPLGNKSIGVEQGAQLMTGSPSPALSKGAQLTSIPGFVGVRVFAPFADDQIER